MTVFKKPEHWGRLVTEVNTLDTFKQVAKGVFSDGIITSHLLMVLELFARDVGKEHPEISKEVWLHFCWVWKTSENPYNRLCWLHSKYDGAAVVNNIVEVLASLFN